MAQQKPLYEYSVIVCPGLEALGRSLLAKEKDTAPTVPFTVSEGHPGAQFVMNAVIDSVRREMGKPLEIVGRIISSDSKDHTGGVSFICRIANPPPNTKEWPVGRLSTTAARS